MCIGRRFCPARREDSPPSIEKSGYSTANSPLSGAEAVPSPLPANNSAVIPIAASKSIPVPTETIGLPTYSLPVISPPVKEAAPANTNTVGNIQRSGASALTMIAEVPTNRISHVSKPPVAPAAKHMTADALFSLRFFIQIIPSAVRGAVTKLLIDGMCPEGKICPIASF